MIWVRACLLAMCAGLLVLVLTQTATAPQPTPAVAGPVPTSPPAPTLPATRVPLPTLAPPMIISRVSHSTPAPLATATPSAQPHVDIVDNGFLPGRKVVSVGDSVGWLNGGSDGHDVTGTGPGGVWRSGTLAPMERYQRQFGITGTYDYVCTLHPEMRGQIVVQP